MCLLQYQLKTPVTISKILEWNASFSSYNSVPPFYIYVLYWVILTIKYILVNVSRITSTKFWQSLSSTRSIFYFFIKKGNKTSFKGSYKSRIDKFATLKERFSFFQFFWNNLQNFVKAIVIQDWFSKGYINVSFLLWRYINPPLSKSFSIILLLKNNKKPSLEI